MINSTAVYNHYLGFLRRKGQPHLLYKPVQFGTKGVREVSFYDALYHRKTTLGDPSMFPSLHKKEGTNAVPLSVLPMYHGVTTIADRGGRHCMFITFYVLLSFGYC